MHAQNQTTLIQTFSYEHNEGTLLKNLERNLHEKGVVFNPIAKEQILSELKERNNNELGILWTRRAKLRERET